ncbi:hypothetical protein ACFWII_33880 [Streptomyces sp. NPDC127063]|uniref:hypothetical protein n=1 Tax=Streptomyces sp. NPDC127063 TaxID=3347123 RepID=UPI0036592785
MSSFHDEAFDGFDEDQGDELVGEDWPTVATPVPVWVLLSGCSPRAYKMYAFLAEHINVNLRDPRKRIACPKQKAIAVILGLKDDRKVARYRKELEALGAIRVEKYRYAGGMRQGYKYFVRYNPPAGYDGDMVLKQFYARHPEFRSAAKWEGRTEAAKKTAAVPAQGSGPAGKGTAPKPPAPKPSGRRPGGEVALPPDVLKVLSAFRPELRAAMRETAHTDAPKTLVTAVSKALKGRTADQLVARVRRRWTTHGYEAKFEAGQLERPVGAAVAMLRHGECPDAGCEDGTVLESGEACVLCIERSKNHRADHAAARKSAKEAAAADARRAARAVVCPLCEQDRGTEGRVCPECVTGMERDVAEAAETAARDIARMATVPEEWSDARARVLAEAAAARADARQAGTDQLGELLAAQLAARAAAREARRVRLAALGGDQKLPPSPAPAAQSAPTAPARPEPVKCSGSRWDGSPCGRLTKAPDGLCGVCRGVQNLQHEDDLAAMH